VLPKVLTGNDEHPVAVHTLACAAREILTNLGHKLEHRIKYRRYRDRHVFAFVCFGLGAAFIFGATHTVDSAFTSFETAAFGGVGAMILLGSFFTVAPVS
jgi:hypothetical protein